MDGATATQINVRSEPSTAGSVLGIVPANTRVQIVGRDPGRSWWQILYPQGVDGKGWVAAQYVTTASGAEVPVVGGAGTGPDNGNMAVIQQKVNIRSGPGTNFNSIGTLNPRDAVTLTGKDGNGTWLQIEFAPGPGGKGWISAAFVQADGVEELPIVTESGVIVGTGTPANTPLPPTPTLVPAWMDNDSAGSPAAQVAFHPLGTRTLIYNGDVSAPEGDAQDWIAFRPYGRSVLASLECTRSDALKVDFLENNRPVRLSLGCNRGMSVIPVKPNVGYLLHLQAVPSSEGLIYINYSLKIQTSP